MIHGMAQRNWLGPASASTHTSPAGQAYPHTPHCEAVLTASQPFFGSCPHEERPDSHWQ